MDCSFIVKEQKLLTRIMIGNFIKKTAFHVSEAYYNHMVNVHPTFTVMAAASPLNI